MWPAWLDFASYYRPVQFHNLDKNHHISHHLDRPLQLSCNGKIEGHPDYRNWVFEVHLTPWIIEQRLGLNMEHNVLDFCTWRKLQILDILPSCDLILKRPHPIEITMASRKDRNLSAATNSSESRGKSVTEISSCMQSVREKENT